MNYNDPIEVTEIYRTVTHLPPDSDGNNVEPDVKEYAFKVAFGWEQVRKMREYCYPDDWITYKGPKFYLYLGEAAEGNLILGDYHSFSNHWRSFRNMYPLFVEYDQNDRPTTRLLP